MIGSKGWPMNKLSLDRLQFLQTYPTVRHLIRERY